MTAIVTTTASSITVTTTASSITTIAEQITAEHKAAERDVRSSVAHAIRCGELLIQAKGSIKHGEWEAWITDNIKLSSRAVQGYMRLARLDTTKAQRVADLSLREALKQVGQEYGRKQKQIERQVDNELRVAKSERAPAPARIIDVEPEPSPVTPGKQTIPAAKKMRRKPDVERMIDDIAVTLDTLFRLCPADKQTYFAAKVAEMAFEYVPAADRAAIIAAFDQRVMPQQATP